MTRRPIIAGVLAADALLALFVLLVTSISGWPAAQSQFTQYWYYIVALAIGFGVQVGLFVYLREAIRARASGKLMAVTGTTSTAAMVSCCAHYLANILPILGASGLATFVGQYQTELFWVGLLFNAFGIAAIGRRVWQFQHQPSLRTDAQRTSMTLRSRPAITNGTVIGSTLIVVAIVWVAVTPRAARTDSNDSQTAMAATSSKAARALETQTSDEAGMTVAVTPKRGSDGSWQFDVAIDNHAQDVTQDMVAVSTLTDDRGTDVRPTAWVGDPPGGHHRQGTLSFPPVASSGLTLTIRELGGVPERTFRWQP